MLTEQEEEEDTTVVPQVVIMDAMEVEGQVVVDT